MPPAFVLRRLECDLHKRTPLRALGFPDQRHLRFTREAVPLLGVARDTGTNHVFPRGRAAAVARDDVVEVEIVAIEHPAAVLAGVLVALEHIVTREFHLLLREAIEEQQHDHARDADLERNRRDQFVIGRVRGEITPAFKIMG